MSLLLLFNNWDLYRNEVTARARPLNVGPDAKVIKGPVRITGDAGVRGPFRWNSKERELRERYDQP